MATVPLMPAAFLGHGSPMNALERNRYTEAWRAFGRAVPWPRAPIRPSSRPTTPTSEPRASPRIPPIAWQGCRSAHHADSASAFGA